MKNLVLSLVVILIAVVGHNPFISKEKHYPVYEPTDTPARQVTSATADDTSKAIAQAPLITIPDQPKLALYPLFAGPELIEQGTAGLADLAASLRLVHHALGATLGSSAAMTLLDRDAQSHPLARNASSPERAALASSEPADYVLSGSLEHSRYGRQLQLQLNHVQTMQLVATINAPLDSDTTLDTASVASRIVAAIDHHRRRVSESGAREQFHLSVAAFIPGSPNPSGNQASKALREGLTQILASSGKYQLMAGDHAMALTLESRLGRHETARLTPDVIVHGRLLTHASSRPGYDLVLMIERVHGLRSTTTLQADSLSALINKAVAAIDARLSQTIVPVSESLRAESAQLMEEAWLKLYRSGSRASLIAGFPSKTNERNRDKISELMTLTRKAIAVDPNNYQAIGAQVLASAATGDRATEYRLLEQLMWDPRQVAFDHARKIMLKRFHRGTVFYIDGEVDGLPGINDRQMVINQLLASRMLVPRGGSGPRYNWANSQRLRYSHDEHAFRQYIAGTRHSIIDDWARFKLTSHRQPIPTAHPKRTDGVSGSFEGSHYYALANASAPIMLTLGANGFYSAPVDVEIDLPDGRPMAAGQMARYLNFIGKSMLADGNNIEADLLYASVMCEYDPNQCAYSRLIYQDIDNNADNVRRRIVGDKDRYGRRRLAADGLIEMARRELQAYNAKHPATTPAPAPAPTTTPVASIPAPSTDVLQLRDCDDCPDYIAASLVSSPDGRWQIDTHPHFDGPTSVQPEMMPRGLRDDQSYTRARAWLFTNRLIDLAGMPTQYRIPSDLAKRDLPILFPGLGKSGIRQLTRGYRATREQRNVGKIIVYNSDTGTSRSIQAPNAFAEQEFGTHVTLSNDQLLVCDAHRNAYLYRLEFDDWHFDRQTEQICITQNLNIESPVAINDDWLISYQLDGRIHFYKDDGAQYKHQITRQINNDFASAHPRGAAIAGIWLSDRTLLVGTTSRNGHRLHYYTLQQDDWAASGSIESDHRFTQIRFHKTHAWQLSDEHIIAYRLEDDKLRYDFQIQIPGADTKKSHRGSILFLQQNQSTQLVWASDNLVESIHVQ